MKFTTFYSERIPNLPAPNDKGEVMVPCVFHADSSPSLGINLESGKWKCFAAHCPGHSGGGWKKFDAMRNGEGGVSVAVQPIDESVVDGFHKALMGSSKVLEMLREKRGITVETIQRFKLGYDGDRIWIPIRDEGGTVVNVRKYKPGAKRDKVVPYAAGYNKPRLFPAENLTSDWLLILEGEMDTLLGNQLGFPAITGTGGADTWPSEFTKAFTGKRVVVCYDTDKSGKKGALEVGRKLLRVASEVKVLELPLPGTPEEKDFTNYLHDTKHTVEDMKRLILEAPVIQPEVASTTGPDDSIEPLHLSLIGQERYVSKRVTSTILVAGKDLAPFQVPRCVAFKCEMGDRLCKRCHIAEAGGQMEVKFPEWDPQLLQMVNVHQLTVESVLARSAGVPNPCRRFTFEVKEHANIEAIKAIPEIDFSSDRSEYVIRQLYYLGHGLEANHTYAVKAVVVPDPKTQYATAIIYEAKASKDNIEEFTLDDATRQMLEMFRV